MMVALPLLLLMAGATRVELTDETYKIPANEWRYVEIEQKQVPVMLVCDYHVESGPGAVRLAVMRRHDMERMRDEDAHGVLALTQPGPDGHVMHPLRAAGNYVVVVDNRGGAGATSVHLRVSLDFAGRQVPAVTTLAPERKLTVILLSFGFFIVTVTWTMKKLWSAVGK